MSRTSPPFAPARLRLAYCESPLHFLSRTLSRHGRGFARAAFGSLVAGVVVSSLRRFARPATMPGDAVSCTTGWSWGGARAPPVGPRSSRGGHGLLFGWANRRWTHPLRMAVTPRTQRIAASNNSEFIFSKAPEPARGRSKRETASATVPTGLRKGEVVLALPVTNVRARHAQHIPAWVMFMRTEGAPPSTWLLVVGQFPSSVARACGVSASRPPPPADVGRASRHGDGRPPGVLSVQALHNTGDLTCPAGGQKCALHFLGLLLSWAHVCGPQPGGLDRDSRRRPMPLIILGRRRLRLNMTTLWPRRLLRWLPPYHFWLR